MSPRVATLPVALFLCLIVQTQVRARQDNGVLQPGVNLSRTVMRDQTHRFTVALEEGECAQVVIDQRGVDLVVRVSGPDAKYVSQYDSPNGSDGPEHARIVAPVAGTYRIDVLPLRASSDVNGSFEIRMTGLRRATAAELQAARRPEILKANGMEFLRRLVNTLPQIRSHYSRLLLQIQAAQLLWAVDEKYARSLAMEAAAGVHEYLQQPNEEQPSYAPPHSRGLQLRSQLFHLLAPNDPELALEFLRRTRFPGIEAPQYSGQPDQEIYLETMVAGMLAKKHPKRAFELAQQTLKDGLSSQLGTVIDNLRFSDPALAATLMKDTVSRLQEENLLVTPDAATLALNLLRTARTPAEGAPLLPNSDYRNLLTKALAEGLAIEVVPNVYSPEANTARNLLTFLKGLGQNQQTFTPEAAASIDQKLAQLANLGNGRAGVYQETIHNGPVDVALEAIARAPRDLRDNLYFQLATRIANTGDILRARQIVTSLIVNTQQRLQALDNIERQTITRAINSGNFHAALEGMTRLRTQTDRLTIAGQALMGMGPRNKASEVVSFLEQLLGIAGVAGRPQGMEQTNFLILTAGVFAQYDAGRGFQIVEPLVDQFNELASAALVLNGFGQQYYENGELALNNGNTLGNVANQLVQSLAKLAVHDPDRAANAIGRIERSEVRAAASLAIAQHLINPPPLPWIQTR